MADEITVSIRLQVAKGSLGIDKNPGDFTPDMAGSLYVAKVVEVGTATHEIVFTAGDIGTEGWCYVQNLSAANLVTIGLDVSAAFCPFAKLLPGEASLFRLAPGVDIYAKATTGDVNLEVVALEA
jgi:hypothetical protein